MSQIYKSSGGGSGSNVSTLSDDTGTSVTPDSSGNIQLVGHVNEQGGTKFSTVTGGTHIENLNPMSSFRWIVDPLGFNGTSTTIQAAINSATAGDTIQILASSTPYTENLTLKDGLSFTSSTTVEKGKAANVNILGKMIDNGVAINCSFTGIGFQTNSDYIASLTAASNLVFADCYLNGSNHTIFNTTNASSNIYLYDCQGDLATTGITFINSSGGTYRFYQTEITNSGNSTTATTISVGSLQLYDCVISFPIAYSVSTTMSAYYTLFDTSPINTTSLAIIGTGSSIAEYCQFNSGSASAISIGTGTTLTATYLDVSSSATNAITGTGTLNYSFITFTGTSSIINTTTQNALTYAQAQPPIGALEYFSTGGTAGTTYPNPQWLICNGATVSQATYPVLFSRVGLLNNGGTFWTNQTIGATSTITNLTFGNSLYVAGGSNGLIYTSTNAVTWTSRTTGVSGAIDGLAYGSGIYCFSESTGRLFSCTDAISWLEKLSPVTALATSMTYGNGLFMQASISPCTSTDGTTWSTRNPSIGYTPAPTNLSNKMFAFGNSTYIAVGCANVTTRVSNSTDGVNFTGQNAATITAINSLSYGNGLFIMAGVSGFLQTSTNGVAWTVQTSGSTSTIVTSTYGNGLYVYGGYGGVLASSTNGSVWSAQSSLTTSTIDALTYGNGLYVYGGMGGVLATSTNCVLWVARTSNTTSTIMDLTYGTVYVYCGNVGALASSTDAVTWTVRSSSTTSTIYSVAYGAGVYVAVGVGGYISSSTDGTTWTVRTNSSTNNLYSVFYNSGFYAGGQNTIVTSTDGITWSNPNPQLAATAASAFGNGTFVITSAVGGIYTSTNGGSWTSQTSGTTSAINGVVYGTQFIYTGNGGVAATSTNGVVWSAVSTGTTSNLGVIGYSNAIYVATFMGSNIQSVLVTQNGTTWGLNTTATSTTIDAITTGNGLFVIGGGVGAPGNIQTSPNTFSYNSSTQFQLPTDANLGITIESLQNFPRSLYIRAL